MDKKIILIGSPGSGKSTIGRKLSEVTKIRYISSGDIARNIALYDPNMHRLLKNGYQAPEHIIRDKIELEIYGTNSFILDGFPRNIGQLQLLYVWFLKQPLIFINIECDRVEAISRIITRGREDMCAINTRMEHFHQETKPMISIIRGNRDILIDICNNNNTKIEDVINKIIGRL